MWRITVNETEQRSPQLAAIVTRGAPKLMTLHLTHTYNDALELAFDKQILFRYVYQPDTPQQESPRPYFHPVYTLTGNLVTNFRPYDHVWHKGISMTIAHLEDQNFWGGGSYRHGQGYVQLPNNGSQRHDSWDEIICDGEHFSATERLSWITEAGGHWIDETRRIALGDLNADQDTWALDFQTSLTNVRGEPLHIGSPTTAGRPLAGYGGLFWRGPRSFLHGDVLAGNDLAGPEVMGQSAPWLAFSGRHDGTAEASTLIFLDHPDNLRYPNKWFTRAEPFACVSFAFMFDEIYVLAPEETISLTYRIVLAHGKKTRADIESLAMVNAFRGR